MKSKSILLPLAAAALAFASCSAGETPKTNAATAADAKGQIEAKQSALKTMHDAFLAKLAAQLSPAQIETVKNKMTYNKTPVTFNAYCEIAGNLTDAQKARVLEMLKDARETAMDGRNAEDMSVVYKKFKGRINNYLSKEGVDMGKATKEWSARQKQAASETNTNAPAQTNP